MYRGYFPQPSHLLDQSITLAYTSPYPSPDDFIADVKDAYWTEQGIFVGAIALILGAVLLIGSVRP